MFCEKCGTKNMDSSKFCEKCGAPLISNAISTDVKPNTENTSGDKTNAGNPSNINQNVGNTSNVNPKVDITKGQRNTHVPKAKFKISKWSVAIAIEIILLAVLAYGAKLIGEKYYSPTFVAEKYFETVMEGDLKKAYDYLDIKASDFISADMFEKTSDIDGRGNLKNFYVKERKRDLNSVTVEVTYQLKDDTEKYKKEILMEKTSKKKFFIFDEWKVNPIEKIVIKDVSVLVPNGADAWLDEIKLNKEESTESDGYDVYIIDRLFIGHHVVKATKTGTQDVVENFYIGEERLSNDIEMKILQMYLTEERNKLINVYSQKVFRKIIDSKIKGEDGAFIEDLVKDAGGIEYTKNCYEDFLPSNTYSFRVKNISVSSQDYELMTAPTYHNVKENDDSNSDEYYDDEDYDDEDYDDEYYDDEDYDDEDYDDEDYDDEDYDDEDYDDEDYDDEDYDDEYYDEDYDDEYYDEDYDDEDYDDEYYDDEDYDDEDYDDEDYDDEDYDDEDDYDYDDYQYDDKYYYSFGEEDEVPSDTFSATACPIVAKVLIKSTCISENSYGYQNEREVTAVFNYGYVNGNLSLLAVHLSSDY